MQQYRYTLFTDTAEDPPCLLHLTGKVCQSSHSLPTDDRGCSGTRQRPAPRQPHGHHGGGVECSHCLQNSRGYKWELQIVLQTHFKRQNSALDMSTVGAADGDICPDLIASPYDAYLQQVRDGARDSGCRHVGGPAVVFKSVLQPGLPEGDVQAARSSVCSTVPIVSNLPRGGVIMSIIINARPEHERKRSRRKTSAQDRKTTRDITRMDISNQIHDCVILH